VASPKRGRHGQSTDPSADERGGPEVRDRSVVLDQHAAPLARRRGQCHRERRCGRERRDSSIVMPDGIVVSM
jgi:hypothetical protein